MSRQKHGIRNGAIALLSLALIAAACGDDDDDSGSTGAPDTTDAPDDGGDGTAGGPDATDVPEAQELSGSLTVTGSTSRTEDDSFLAIAATAFEDEHPDVSVTLEGAELDHLSQTLPAQINAGRAPDIISTATAYGLPISAFNLADQLVDLTDEEWVERLPDSIRDQVSLDGRTYSLPTDMLMIGMHYDPAVFEAEELEVPETFDELLELCETAVDRETIGVALSAGEPYLQQDFMTHGLAAANVYDDDPDFTANLREGATTFADSAGWSRALEQLQQMNETGCFGPNPLAVSREAAEEQFAVGGAYTLASYSLGQARVEPLNPDAEFKLFPVPADDADQRRVPMGPVVGLVIPESGENVELAKAFLAFVAERSEEFALASEGAVIPAVVDDPENPPPLPDYMSEMEPLIREGRVTEIYGDQWPYPDVRTVYDEGVASIVQGSMEPQQVLDAMDGAWATAE